MPTTGRPIPSPGLLAQADAFARAIFPASLTAALMILALVPTGLPGLAGMATLIPVFFWSVFRPATVPPPAVFALGLLLDLLTAAPLGGGVLALLLAHALAARWRRALSQGAFVPVWLAFAGFAAGFVALGWALQATLAWQMPPPGPAVAQLALGIGLYPMLAWMLTRLHRALDLSRPA